ncbi:hypothetical protein DF153_17605 [Burkholderia cenocepacia]|nr:hypothetical protein DF152_19070 [Burkholderia cenocepacia]RQU23440.1 hypothetical protein DF153_17605 [Burkholderia cenocepacia]
MASESTRGEAGGTGIGIPSGGEASGEARGGVRAARGRDRRARRERRERSIIRRGARPCSVRALLAADSPGCLLARRCGIVTLKS